MPLSLRPVQKRPNREMRATRVAQWDHSGMRDSSGRGSGRALISLTSSASWAGWMTRPRVTRAISSKHLRAGRLAGLFNLHALGEQGGFERFVFGAAGGGADFPCARQVHLEAPAEGTPGGGVFLEFDALGASVGRGQIDGDGAFFEWRAVGIEGIGIEGDGGAGFRAFRGEEQAHALAGGHVPLIGHPAGDLAPEPIVIEILDAAAPAPGGIDAHEEHLAAARGFGDEQRDRAEFAAAVAVDGEHFRRRPWP